MDLFSSQPHPDWLWGPPSLLFCGYRGVISPGVKQPGREADHWSPFTAEFKNAWSYTSTPPSVFMAWYLVKLPLLMVGILAPARFSWQWNALGFATCRSSSGSCYGTLLIMTPDPIWHHTHKIRSYCYHIMAPRFEIETRYQVPPGAGCACPKLCAIRYAHLLKFGTEYQYSLVFHFLFCSSSFYSSALFFMCACLICGDERGKGRFRRVVLKEKNRTSGGAFLN